MLVEGLLFLELIEKPLDKSAFKPAGTALEPPPH